MLQNTNAWILRFQPKLNKAKQNENPQLYFKTIAEQSSNSLANRNGHSDGRIQTFSSYLNQKTVKNFQT